MSTLQEFLIKSAGMEKVARTAIAKRLLASTMTPQEVIKRFGKVKGQQYLGDITTAVKNHVNALSTPVNGKDKTRNYLRGIITANTARQLHFNNKLSKSDYLKHLTDNSGWYDGIGGYQRTLLRAGSKSGLSDLYRTLPRQDKLIVSKYLRGIVPETGLQQLPNDVYQAAQNARARLLTSVEGPTLPKKK